MARATAGAAAAERLEIAKAKVIAEDERWTAGEMRSAGVAERWSYATLTLTP